MTWLMVGIMLVYAGIFILEVQYDLILKELEMESTNNVDRRRKWHRLDWQMKALSVIALTAVLVFLLGFQYLALPFLIGSTRVFILNFGINLKSKSESLLYLSSEGFESKFKGKEWLYYLAWLVVWLFSGYIVII